MVVIDGFPRNLENYNAWMANARYKTKCLIELQVKEEILRSRIVKRGLSSGRLDDNMSSFRKRIKVWKEETGPVIRQFRKDGFTVLEVDSNKCVAQSFENMKRAIVQL